MKNKKTTSELPSREILTGISWKIYSSRRKRRPIGSTTVLRSRNLESDADIRIPRRHGRCHHKRRRPLAGIVLEERALSRRGLENGPGEQLGKINHNIAYITTFHFVIRSEIKKRKRRRWSEFGAEEKPGRTERRRAGKRRSLRRRRGN